MPNWFRTAPCSTVAATACGLGLGDVLERSGKLRAFRRPGVASAGLSLMGVMAHHVTALGAYALSGLRSRVRALHDGCLTRFLKHPL